MINGHNFSLDILIKMNGHNNLINEMKNIAKFRVKTVNMVIFIGGKVCKMLERHFTLGLFSQYNSYVLHKDIWVLFSRVISAKKLAARKTRKLPPCENFHVYSLVT